MSAETRWAWTRAYVPESQAQRDRNVEWCAERIEDAARTMLHYGPREEFLKWAGEIYDRTVDSYNDWLSTQ